ncbi:uncharacterized protein LOC115291416 [Suricata suricatta]|uniref:uncharacterized protein LOC115291416 n=1 Tax=Suricata suricatta TaxID=37032 RepID=UPI001155A24F|nr:uncharacterized protein LOC115291416 [Suricata suricatta]XP_029794727.1 uncharacterized protein LOC115291416 [Suricata suricatta]
MIPDASAAGRTPSVVFLTLPLGSQTASPWHLGVPRLPCAGDRALGVHLPPVPRAPPLTAQGRGPRVLGQLCGVGAGQVLRGSTQAGGPQTDCASVAVAARYRGALRPEAGVGLTGWHQCVAIWVRPRTRGNGSLPSQALAPPPALSSLLRAPSSQHCVPPHVASSSVAAPPLPVLQTPGVTPALLPGPRGDTHPANSSRMSPLARPSVRPVSEACRAVVTGSGHEGVDIPRGPRKLPTQPCAPGRLQEELNSAPEETVLTFGPEWARISIAERGLLT